MSSFYEFLQQRNRSAGFTTEDVLVSFLPLLRQVADCHGRGMVAPLKGLEALQVDGPRIWFEDARRSQPLSNTARVSDLLADMTRGAAVIVDEHRVLDAGSDGVSEQNGPMGLADEQIGRDGEPLQKPVYLPRYLAWEHQIEHHDPLTDVFSLGLILASLTCGLDLHDPSDLRAFVAHRRNLFRLHAEVHPVLARQIEKMTELDRRKRPSDLPMLLNSLENFGEQQVDFQLELDRIDGFHTKDLETKHQIVLSKLQDRLFEVSRRNRLLHFRSTMQSVNLTEASVPLSFDYKNIRPEQLLTWNSEFAQQALPGNPIRLEKYLNFEEAIYLPIVLDRIRNEARRDQAEFGFSQLRLVACFLRWTNTKATPTESYHSPLALLPVELVRKKGVKDTYQMRLLSPLAEVNPVLRHQFKQLYGIDLPETIDLEETDFATFHRYLSSQVRSSEPAIEVELIDKPRISVLHDKARRRLDSYRRRAKLSGRGVRSYMDLDYSYDPANYHPLGLKIFSTFVRESNTRLSAIVEEHPRPHHFAAPSEDEASGETKSRTFFELRRGDDNPFHWEFDLCSMTLGNFRYRKMSLVRDYAAVADAPIENDAFDGIFCLSPRPAPIQVDTPPLEQRFHVVPCDPTQTLSIARAETGASYIIQGPPGTGKSQTITNLIADYVARGKRVLFVCEKRAAIDVVYLRLRQQGLDELCSLIHDSQQDKKQFVMDLKRTYERFLNNVDEVDDHERSRATAHIERELQPLESFRQVMREADQDGVCLSDVIQRAVALREILPELNPTELEQAPDFAVWTQHNDQLQRFALSLREATTNRVFSSHPLCRLSPRLAGLDRPLEAIANALETCQARLNSIDSKLAESRFSPDACPSTLDELRKSAELCERWELLARFNLLSLLDPNSAASSQYADSRSNLRSLESRLLEAKEQNEHWRNKLSARESEDALRQAKRFENQWWSFINPAWWKLRSVLKRCYDFESHAIQPSWSDVLQRLIEEHTAEKSLEQAESECVESFGIRDFPPHDFFVKVEMLRDQAEGLLDSGTRAFAEELIASTDGAKRAADIGAADRLREEFFQAADGVLEGVRQTRWPELNRQLAGIVENQDQWDRFLDCLADLNELPEELVEAIRNLPLELDQIEAAAAEKYIDCAFREHKQESRFDSATRNHHAQRLERQYEQWLAANAQEVRRRVADRFRENVRICSLPASQLSAEQKTFKKRYQQGRKVLEREFGKSMRYKSIRDLVSDESGEVVKDLKPVWLMSPLSVSDTVPLDHDHFDVVIFDEASQITLEEAVPTIFRATQAIVVGDEMQLPPTDFFSSKRDEEETLMIEEDGELVEYDLDSNSLLSHSARNLPATMLGWHYRSRSESLISFSNWSFYNGDLLTVPEEDLPSEKRAELVATSAEDGAKFAVEIADRPVSFHFLEHGVYEKRRNRAEADYIAQLVRECLSKSPHYSIGIVAFSEAQQDEIESAMQRLAGQDREFADRFEREIEREEEDGQFAGLLIKNLENIQGDERDMIIMSVCYGRDSDGKMRMNFGPINRHGGEKRLNVAFSRAKHRMLLVSSIRHFDITNDYNDGANCLKRYLLYAERVSTGDMEGAQRLLEEIAVARSQPERGGGQPNAIAEDIARQLRDHGYQVDFRVGQSQFRCDLAVYREGDTCYRLGIRLDTDAYYEDGDPLERELMKPKLLRDFGWRVEVLLAKDWHADHETLLARLLDRLAECEQEASAEAADSESASTAHDLGGDETSEQNGNREPVAGPEVEAAEVDDATAKVDSNDQASLDLDDECWDVDWPNKEDQDREPGTE